MAGPIPPPPLPPVPPAPPAWDELPPVPVEAVDPPAPPEPPAEVLETLLLVADGPEVVASLPQAPAATASRSPAKHGNARRRGPMVFGSKESVIVSSSSKLIDLHNSPIHWVEGAHPTTHGVPKLTRHLKWNRPQWRGEHRSLGTGCGSPNSLEAIGGVKKVPHTSRHHEFIPSHQLRPHCA